MNTVCLLVNFPHSIRIPDAIAALVDVPTQPLPLRPDLAAHVRPMDDQVQGVGAGCVLQDIGERQCLLATGRLEGQMNAPG
ncbi:MAG: hypothetical protein WBF93_00835, partial [Pirellulales bacterium]